MEFFFFNLDWSQKKKEYKVTTLIHISFLLNFNLLLYKFTFAEVVIITPIKNYA